MLWSYRSRHTLIQDRKLSWESKINKKNPRDNPPSFTMFDSSQKNNKEDFPAPRSDDKSGVYYSVLVEDISRQSQYTRTVKARTKSTPTHKRVYTRDESGTLSSDKLMSMVDGVSASSAAHISRATRTSPALDSVLESKTVSSAESGPIDSHESLPSEASNEATLSKQTSINTKSAGMWLLLRCPNPRSEEMRNDAKNKYIVVPTSPSNFVGWKPKAKEQLQSLRAKLIQANVSQRLRRRLKTRRLLTVLMLLNRTRPGDYSDAGRCLSKLLEPDMQVSFRVWDLMGKVSARGRFLSFVLTLFSTLFCVCVI